MLEALVVVGLVALFMGPIAALYCQNMQLKCDMRITNEDHWNIIMKYAAELTELSTKVKDLESSITSQASLEKRIQESDETFGGLFEKVKL